VTSNSESDNKPSNSRLRWLLITVAVLVVPVVIIWWPGCREYPPVSSKESLMLTKLLYSACNTRDEKRLAEVEQRAEKLHAEGKMTPAEKEAFDSIIATAKKGDWEDAEKAAFKFSEDQVGVGHPNPEEKHDHEPKKGN